MNMKLILAIICMVLALAAYSRGVWGERLSGTLRKSHVIYFWIGLCFDTTGTWIMTQISHEMDINGRTSLHGIVGTIAIVLMLFHAIVAIYVIKKGKKTILDNFHKFSVFVWGFWLCVFIFGMVIGMN